MQHHGIGRQVQRTSSGSTPHEPVTIPQISSSRSPASDRPRQSTLRYPALVSNRPTVHHVRRDPPPIHQPLHRRPTCRGGSIPITNLSRGSQIAIAPAARPSFPQARFPPLEAFGRRPRARRPTVMGPASETLHNSGHLPHTYQWVRFVHNIGRSQPYSITSSARASSVGGMVRSIALAVLPKRGNRWDVLLLPHRAHPVTSPTATQSGPPSASQATPPIGAIPCTKSTTPDKIELL